MNYVKQQLNCTIIHIHAQIKLIFTKEVNKDIDVLTVID